MLEVISLGQNNPNNLPILNGITFGFMGLPLFFVVKHKKIETDLMVELLVDNNEKMKPNEFVFNKIENNVLKISYFNPSHGTSGLVNPFGLKLFDNDIFAFMFYVDYLKGSTSFRLTYEFYQGKLQKD
ncbi:MAG TPA: hypothetical protein VFP20_00025 [Bacteroidales bacterium]|nr:hypothetical protein [Bacteroidales bacterium]